MVVVVAGMEGHLADGEVVCLADGVVGHLADRVVGHLADGEVGCLADGMVVCLADGKVVHLADGKEVSNPKMVAAGVGNDAEELVGGVGKVEAVAVGKLGA